MGDGTERERERERETVMAGQERILVVGLQRNGSGQCGGGGGERAAEGGMRRRE